ncbi:serine hydrolase domain-containing protein [Chitinophaga varians]|uniref:serine hydrolase domain-containing protein n=1 Tax=Chitinophaga varians TaxID=2202339 RepID=UPI00165FC490|nr:serine hydrolase domain-containing protein [Chitinophaga varians]MBC9912788.1 beta-lactamase family protein [Chitinophaga varians]
MTTRNLLVRAAATLLLSGMYTGRSVAQMKKPLLTDNKLLTPIDSVVDHAAGIYMSHKNTVGLSIGIYRKGRFLTYNYGEVKKGSGKLPSPDNFCNIGSVAKTFVGTMLAQAIVEGKVKPEDDIRKYLPGNYPNLEYHGRAVQLVDLANHTAALPQPKKEIPEALRENWKKLPMQQQVDFFAAYNQDSLLADLHHVKPDTIPGTRYRYSSHGMMLLMVILERVYHQPYNQLLTNFLHKHLHMKDTRQVLSAADMKRAAQGYDKAGNPQPFVNLEGFYIGPSMNSTVRDMLKFLEANLTEKDPAVKLTHQLTFGKPDGFGSGLSWMIDTDTTGARYIYHDGSVRIGFNTLCLFYPEKQLGFIIIANDTVDQAMVGEVENNISRGLSALKE